MRVRMDNLNKAEQRKPALTTDEEIASEIESIIRNVAGILWAWAWLHWRVRKPNKREGLQKRKK